MRCFTRVGLRNSLKGGNEMKRLLLVLCLCCFTSTAFAQTAAFFQVETATPNVHDKMNINAGATTKLNGEFSLRFFTLVNSGWAQAYMGPVYQPVEWLKLGVGAGGRQTKEEIDLQTGYLLWLGYGRFSFNGAVEAGRVAFVGDKTQVWYDLTARVNVLPWLTLGVKDRRPAGIGPLVEFNAWKMMIWGAWTPFDSEKAEVDWARFLVGAKINM